MTVCPLPEMSGRGTVEMLEELLTPSRLACPDTEMWSALRN